MQKHIVASLLQRTERLYPKTVNVAKHPVGKHNDSLRPRGLAHVFSEFHLPHVWVSKNQRGPSHNADGRVLGCAIRFFVIFETPEYTIQVPHQPRAGNKVDGLFGPWDAKIAASAQSPTAEESPMMPNDMLPLRVQSLIKLHIVTMPEFSRVLVFLVVPYSSIGCVSENACRC